MHGLYISTLGQKQCLNFEVLFIFEDGFWLGYDSNLILLKILNGFSKLVGVGGIHGH